MKKIIKSILFVFLIIFIDSCAGYKPIYKASLQFEISDYSLNGDKKTANQIYSKLYNLANISKNNPDRESISIFIKTTKSKTPTIKNSSGKILEYKINLTTQVIIKNFLTGDEILNYTFDQSSSYKVQDQYFETTRLENASIENLVNNTYEELIIQLTGNLS